MYITYDIYSYPRLQIYNLHLRKPAVILAITLTKAILGTLLQTKLVSIFGKKNKCEINYYYPSRHKKILEGVR